MFQNPTLNAMVESVLLDHVDDTDNEIRDDLVQSFRIWMTYALAGAGIIETPEDVPNLSRDEPQPYIGNDGLTKVFEFPLSVITEENEEYES